ncbi:MAG: YeeE/YedE thiosulfate transporter family protein [Myxococcota bacterium]
MEHFTPLSALVGGSLIGLSASILLLFTGRVAGISGIYAGILRPVTGDFGWRVAFIGGLIAGGFALMWAAPTAIAVASERSLATTALAGLVVGLGVRMGAGCTSGHGVCGIARASNRSLIATITFVGAGMITASLMTLLGGGA